MQWAQVYAVGFQAERALSNARDWFHSIDNIEDGQLRWRFYQGDATANAALRPHDSCPAQGLNHLRQIRFGDEGRRRNLVGRAR